MTALVLVHLMNAATEIIIFGSRVLIDISQVCYGHHNTNMHAFVNTVRQPKTRLPINQTIHIIEMVNSIDEKRLLSCIRGRLVKLGT